MKKTKRGIGLVGHLLTGFCTSRACSAVLDSRWFEARGRYGQENQMSAHGRLPNKDQIPMKLQSGAPSPMSFFARYKE